MSFIIHHEGRGLTQCHSTLICARNAEVRALMSVSRRQSCDDAARSAAEEKVSRCRHSHGTSTCKLVRLACRTKVTPIHKMVLCDNHICSTTACPFAF